MRAMPTLTRLILIFLILMLGIFGGMLGLVMWVKPVVSELTIDVPADDVVLRPWPSAVPAQQKGNDD